MGKELRIEGVIIELASKFHLDDDDTLRMLAERDATVRLFGVGITNNTVIAFTDESKERGSICDKIKSREFRVSL